MFRPFELLVVQWGNGKLQMSRVRGKDERSWQDSSRSKTLAMHLLQHDHYAQDRQHGQEAEAVLVMASIEENPIGNGSVGTDVSTLYV